MIAAPVFVFIFALLFAMLVLCRTDSRQTTASLAIGGGANVRVMQRMLGHATAAMTFDLYRHLLDDDLTGVADAPNKAIGATAT